MLVFWIAAVIVFVVAETVTVQLVAVWFAVSSAFALFAAILGAPVGLQILVFAVCSLILLAATRPLARRLARRTIPTNADRAIGATALVTKAIGADSVGQVTINGQVWSALSVGGAVPAGAKVLVHAIEGVKLIVEEMPVAAKI
ncbi:MAG: NfeD family protein [Oscillospiraceae bacterium]|jgi:membrane protein implicated in regulation of membrane protease activity|nr:NfeD family protein [Oscillospiraceae bacterium]